MSGLGTVGLVSLEPWDGIWRRNQYLASRLVRGGFVQKVIFVGPPAGGFAPRALRWSPEPGIDAVVAPLVVPRSAPLGYRMLGHWLRHELRSAELIWVNDPVLGVRALRPGTPAVYDVTDDLRELRLPDAARVVQAEDELAVRAGTIVCSQVLAERWHQRYGLRPPVVRNGVDVRATDAARPRDLSGPGPHAVYVGTVHPNRVDVPLVLALARDWAGTVHLVGPLGLDDADLTRLRAQGVDLPGPVSGPEVASWLVAADVLICPHLVDGFTLSLDAIKAHEYLATRRPVVATPSSGFQALSADGLVVAGPAEFVAAVRAASSAGPFARTSAVDWSDRARQFAQVLAGTVR